MQHKPSTASGYASAQLDACRRVLVEFCRGLGPWNSAVYLVGGLAPSIRDPEPGPNVPPHLGTLDIDLFLDTSVLQGVDAYHSLKQNIQRMGLERGRNRAGVVQLYRWEHRGVDGQNVSIDLLCDVPNSRPGTAVSLPGENGLSALAIPASSLVVRDHVTRRVVVEDLMRDMVLDEVIQVAGISTSLVLKAYAFEQRPDGKGKDAYDIVWSLMAHPGGPVASGYEFAERLAGEYGTNHYAEASAILRRRFADDAQALAIRKEGPTSYAEFVAEERSGAENRRRRREAELVVGQFLMAVDQATDR